ncbi:MAG: TlpA family protein disulfide reductase [Deltaproteobacteria bacterium]|nr:TlpA family protein disulfide reductase [Deltaproteobacteria bacterium]
MRGSVRLVAFAAVLLLGGGCLQRAALPPLAGPVSSPPAELLALQVARYGSGEPFDLAAERGNVVLLDVWATWCEPCVEALPLYAHLQETYGARGLRVYALNVDEDEAVLPAFLQAHRVKLPVLRDPNAALSERLLKVKVMPTSFLVDRRGVVRHVHEGFSETFLPLYERELEALLSEGEAAR